MPHIPNRPQRVADLIQRELAQLLLREAHDPRFANVTITNVDVSPDLANANIYITLLDEKKIKGTLAALNHASGFLRHHLADAVDLRIIPKLHFIYDETIRRADKISKLINSIDPDKSKE